MIKGDVVFTQWVKFYPKQCPHNRPATGFAKFKGYKNLYQMPVLD